MFFREITTVYAAYHTKTNHTLCVSGEEFPRVEAPGTYSNSRKLKQKKNQYSRNYVSTAHFVTWVL
jgi:hypothetical protein